MPGPRSSGNVGVAKSNSGCLIPFGALFAIAGAGMAVSALFRDPVRASDTTPRLLLSLIFCAVGIVVLIWGLAGRRADQSSTALRSLHPDQPWLWRKDWAQGSAEAESKSQFLTYLLMGILAILVSAPALLNFNRELFERHNRAILVALVFPLAGLLPDRESLGRQGSRAKVSRDVPHGAQSWSRGRAPARAHRKRFSAAARRASGSDAQLHSIVRDLGRAGSLGGSPVAGENRRGRDARAAGRRCAGGLRDSIRRSRDGPGGFG